MANSWTDNPATNATRIRAIHINEIRATVDNDRRAAGLGGYAWTDSPLSPSTHIRAIHFAEVRTAIQQVPNAPALPNWSVGSAPSPSRQVSARDVNDLRNWTDQLSQAVGEQFGPIALSTHGIVSFSYDATQHLTVAGTDTTWTNDVAQLKTSGPLLLIRTPIQSNANDNTLGSAGYTEFQAAMDTWGQRGFTVGAVLPMEFDRPEKIGFCPNDNREVSNPLLNNYINDFSFRAEDFANKLAGHHLTTFWVWNEPNLRQVTTGSGCGSLPPADGSLSPQVYAAMLYQGCTRIKAGAQAAGQTATVYAGSLSVIVGLTDPNGPLCAGYLDAMYQYLNLHGVAGPYPWDALSLNMENYPDSGFISQVVAAIRAKQLQYRDTLDGSSSTPTKPIIIGEWGARNDQLDPNRARTTYDALRSSFPTMYFFQHPDFQQHDANNFGARDWNTPGGQYVTANKLRWWDVLASFYQTP